MGDGTGGAVTRLIKTLWDEGVLGEADDSSLIACYSSRRDERGEAAFRILVERHGPMVLRACRQILGDGPDAPDAAQAVFLVLARKAGTIRNRGSAAPWLHGVACRVATRARRGLARRRANDHKLAAARSRDGGVGDRDRGPFDWDALHEEVARLPEKYRAPVVLCYLEGRSYEEASRQIGCPVGTVRVRLSRARDRLRDRLARRGFGPPTFLPGVLPPPGWIESTLRMARAFTAGRGAEAGGVAVSTLFLTQEVLRSMMITKLKVAAFGILTVGSLAAGGQVLVGQVEVARPAPAGVLAKSAEPVAADPERELLGRLVESGRRRLEAQRKFFEEGRITIDRYLDASTQLMQAETQAATKRAQRVAAVKANLDRVRAVETREKSDLEAGRSTVADLSEATQRREQAELDLIQAEKSGGRFDFDALERRVASLESKLDRVIKLVDLLNPGRGDVGQRVPLPVTPNR